MRVNMQAQRVQMGRPMFVLVCLAAEASFSHYDRGLAENGGVLHAGCNRALDIRYPCGALPGAMQRPGESSLCVEIIAQFNVFASPLHGCLSVVNNVCKIFGQVMVIVNFAPLCRIQIAAQCP